MQDAAGISNQIWDLKYRLKTAAGEALDETVEDTWSRVALAVSAAETTPARKHWSGEFAKILSGILGTRLKSFCRPIRQWRWP